MNEESPGSGASGSQFSSWLRTAAAAPSLDASHVIDFRPGERIHEFEIKEALGRGGMGVVYRAHDCKLDREVAIKLLRYDLASDERSLALLEREARSTARLRHPNVVTLFQTGRFRGCFFLVLELLEGETLAARLARAPPSLQQALGWARQIIEGLRHAHRMNVIHRDLKPENVFLDRDGRIRLLDFGLAGLTEAASTKSAASSDENPSISRICAGTPAYMPPEQWVGRADARSDLYAFGVVLLELVIGSRVSASQPTTHEHERTTSPRARVCDSALRTVGRHILPDEAAQPLSSLPPALRRLIEECLEPDPERRVASADTIAETLAAVEAELERVDARLGSRLSSVHRLVRRNRRWVASGALIFMAIFAQWGAPLVKDTSARPVAYWPGDLVGNAAELLEDRAHGDHHARIVGPVRLAAGVVGSSFCFESAGYAETDSMHTVREAYTLATWVRALSLPSDSSRNPSWIDHWNHRVNARGFVLGLSKHHAVAGTSPDGSLRNALFPRDPQSLPLERWVHFVTTFDGEHTVLYRNGERVSSHESASPFELHRPAPDYGVRIGRSYNDGVHATFNGCFDEMAIWDEALSPEDVMALYRRGQRGETLL